jgi:hypothetical protein
MGRLRKSHNPHHHQERRERGDINLHLPLLKRFNSNPAQHVRVQVRQVHQNRIGVPTPIRAILFPCRTEDRMVHLPYILTVPGPDNSPRGHITPISRAGYNHSPFRVRFKLIRIQNHTLPSHGWKIIIYTNTYTKTNNRPNARSVVLLPPHLLVHPPIPSTPFLPCSDHMAPIPLAHI